ncbi:hypothetical protein K469DRAFT_656174 [Zopfia rhizophila CBS 207.26]|uniref:RING-type E3 ubiquitin transferase n=1 Tax=Zopfia rhizophila CBS 207.26 TaxID=1314779 RepID=A0A6A6EN40_9PEZI|nr:hypothetical protein K469DRAFT_656174 [Zopfia rhizophila CBS 207.26]
MALRKLPWRLTCALFAMAAAEIVPSNTTTAISGFNGIFQLQNSSRQNISELVPLTEKARGRNNSLMLGGALYNTNQTSFVNITNRAIAYISCDPDDYPGNVNAQSVFESAYNQQNLTAVIFYSTTSDFCAYNDPPDPIQEFSVFSMANKDDSKKVLEDIDDLPVSNLFFTSIIHFGNPESTNHTGPGDRTNQQNPLGPSPSTAVAMIILYSITGIITALFLVIIITGAVRAHRHPDRYGPRDVLGRPRQSRARGLGRAILDTLPIVKFGERESPKPTDVEMGSTPEARNVNDSSTESGGQNNRDGAESRSAEQTEAQQDGAAEHSGIAPAQPVAAGAVPTQDDASPDEGLGCSICTDDFEKGQDIRVLPCNHKFHPECVDPWLLNVSGTCPLCRVDLRPTTSRTTAGEDEQDPDSLAPPLQPEAEASTRRRSALRDILSLRSHPNASAEERISALRRLREQHRNQSGDVSGANLSVNGSSDDVANVRRSRRISARLHDVFNVRTRRNGSNGQEGQTGPAEASSSSAQTQATEDPAPRSSSPNERNA